MARDEAAAEETVILSFCGECGALLEPGLGLEESPTCPNCNENVKNKEDRIEGVFTEAEAKRLNKIYFGE